MNLDLRVPMGLMFFLTGAIMAVYGVATNGDPMYSKSDGLNINLIWGAVMFVFGMTMFLFGQRSHRRHKAAPVEPTTQPLSERRGAH